MKSPGIWPTKEELKGESPRALEDPRGRGNYASAEIHSDDIRKTFGIWIWSLAPLLLRRRHPSVDVTYQNYAQVLWPLSMKETRSAPSTMAPGEVPMHTFRPIQKNAPQPLQSWTASTAFTGCRRHKKNRDTKAPLCRLGLAQTG